MWLPSRVFFEERSLDYSRGQKMHARFRELKVPVEILAKGKGITGIPRHPAPLTWNTAKDVLVVRVSKTDKFAPCKPSAHYQLPLTSSCPGKCEYCYLHTTLGKRPYLRVYVNLEEILARAMEHVRQRLPEITVFEGSATSDPVPTEPFSNSLAETIEFFGRQQHARFKFVTKFTAVDSLLTVEHNKHTRFRFSVNAAAVIDKWEHATPGLEERLAAIGRVAVAGYPMGILIAPVFIVPGWQDQYSRLLARLGKVLDRYQDLTLEIILHRFTNRAKTNILEIFPGSTLPMETTVRKYKYGQFGYGKWVYPQDIYQQASDFFREQVAKFLPGANIEYLV